MGQVLRNVYFNSVSAVGTSSVTAAHGFGRGGKRTFQVVNIATGTSAVTAVVQASNNGVNFVPRGTITTTGTGTTTTAGYTVEESWGYWQVALTAVGTSAIVSVISGEEG